MFTESNLLRHLAGLVFALSASVAQAVTINDSQNNASNGQLFTFNFTGLPASDGTGGTFFVNLNGDYTDGASEDALIKLDLGADTLLPGPDGVVDGLAGLTLFSFNTTVFNATTDVLHEFTFDISSGLLNTLLSDNAIRVDVKNDMTVSAVSFSQSRFRRGGFHL